MQLSFIQPALVACFLSLLVHSAIASDPLPDNTPSLTPTPTVSPIPTVPPTPSIPPTPEVRDDLIPPTPAPATPPPGETPSATPTVNTSPIDEFLPEPPRPPPDPTVPRISPSPIATPTVSPAPTVPPTPSIPPTPEVRDDLIPPPPGTPPPQETPSPSPPVTPPTIPPALPTPPGNITIDPQLGVNPGEVIPVVVTYDAGQEARARIFRDVMDPVGLLQNQVVTVTLQLPPTKTGEQVHFGLYDGGLIGAAALPGSEMIALDNLVVPDTGTVRFNFKAGKILGLYRLQVTIGPSQYLLQFYAVQRPTGGPLPALTPTPSPEG